MEKFTAAIELTPDRRAQASAYTKAWRAKKIAEDPTYLERERAAKAESRKRWHIEKRAEDPVAYREYMNAKQREWRAKKLAEDPMAQRIKERAWAKTFRTKQLEQDPEKLRRQWANATRKYKYGVTPAEYDALRERAGYCCEICGIAESDMPKRNHIGISLHLDHCHQTKRVRGVLCFHCNAMLGHAEDKPEVFEKAIAYLKEHG